MDDLRAAAAEVAQRARWVRVQPSRIEAYARELAEGADEGDRTLHDNHSLPPDRSSLSARIPGSTRQPSAATGPLVVPGPEFRPHTTTTLTGAEREALTARWLTLDAINFGSGWFPTLRKRPGLSGSRSIAAALQDRFAARGPWSADELTALDPGAVAETLGQDPGHELMALYAASLNDLGHRIATAHGGSFTALVDAANHSAVALARRLGSWDSFADTSRYQELSLPFLKRAQIAAADLHRAGAAVFTDLGDLTMFADNLVPHVLHLDGVLRFDPGLVARIDAGALLRHDSPEEIEMRAAAVHAVELIVAGAGTPSPTAAAVDELLWHRGQLARYKAVPRPRCRCTAY